MMELCEFVLNIWTNATITILWMTLAQWNFRSPLSLAAIPTNEKLTHIKQHSVQKLILRFFFLLRFYIQRFLYFYQKCTSVWNCKLYSLNFMNIKYVIIGQIALINELNWWNLSVFVQLSYRIECKTIFSFSFSVTH